MQENQEELRVIDYIFLLRRHAAKLILAMIIGIAGGLILYWRTPPTYRARCRVLIEERQSRIVDLQDMYVRTSVPGDFYETQYRLIKSRSVAMAVAKRLRLGLREGPFKGSSDAEIGNAILDAISVTPDGNSRLVWVSYTGPAGDLTVDVANAIVRAYKEAADARHKERIDRDLDAKRDELPRLRTMLREAEQKRRKFQEQHAIISADKTHQIMMDRLAQLSSALTEAQQERLKAQLECNQVKAAEGRVERLLVLPVIADNPQIISLRTEQLKLEQHLIDLQKELGPKHADVLAADAKRRDIDRRMRERAGVIAKTIESGLDASVIREKEIALLAKEAEQKALELRNVLATYEALCAGVRNIREIYDPTVKLLNEAGALSPRPTTLIHLDEPAESAVKVGPKLNIKILLGALLGLVLGVGVAVLMELLDDSVKNYNDLVQFAQIPVLSIIPHIEEGTGEGRRDKDLICEIHPKSAASESFRSLRTSLTLSAAQNGKAVYLVTSAVPTEGKTTVAVNTGIVMAHGGRKTVIVDGDLRRFGVHKSFGLDNDVGLTDFLRGEKPLDQIVRKTEVENLDVITSGPSVSNPSELLDSPGMDAAVKGLKERYDVVIIDSPPLIAVADPLILARKVNGVLQVVHGNRTSRKAVKRAKDLLESVEAPILGAVLNNIDVTRDGYYYGYYRSRYYKGYYHY